MKKTILSFSNKYISLEQLMDIAGQIDYQEFAVRLIRYTEEGLLTPVKASRLNGRRPALYNKYRIQQPDIDYTDALKNIKLLHPKFDHAKYASQPEVYIKFKSEIDALSRFLWEDEALLNEALSINERSFQIWGVEKLLKEKSVIKNIFTYNGWSMEMLNYYETPEPFFEYNFSEAEEMNILIIENKDTWFSLRKIMQENGFNRLFRDYHVILYGEGKKIISKNNRLQEYDNLLVGQKNHYYYFGDLDYEGINIYEALVAGNEKLEINLCTELYVAMLLKAKSFSLPNTKDGQIKGNVTRFLTHFNEQNQQEIRNILEQGLYIPQEILNYSWMKSKMSEEVNR